MFIDDNKWMNSFSKKIDFYVDKIDSYDIDKSTTIGGVMENSPAYNLGIKVDDEIISINNSNVSSWESMTELIHANPNKKSA